MRFYKICDTLVPVEESALQDTHFQYVVTANEMEWKKHSDILGLQVDPDIDLDPCDVLETKAVVNYDSLTGSFCIPDQRDICGIKHGFTFALNERGILFIDNRDYAPRLIEKIRTTKKWRTPGLERFLYTFLEEIINPDLRMLQEMEQKLDRNEEEILREETGESLTIINNLRGELVDLRMYYEQLMDLGLELEENENEFFREEELYLFRLFTSRVSRLQERVTALREYCVQLRDLVQSKLDEKQNHIMTVLTIITSIFMPLTLIAGWYGMNFKYMPELNWKWSYPVVFLVSVAIVVGCITWFRKKKWM